MFTEPIEMAQASYTWKRGRQLLLSFIALSFALTIHPTKAHAQIIGELEANIPFQFHQGTPNFRRASMSSTRSTTPICRSWKSPARTALLPLSLKSTTQRPTPLRPRAN